MGFIGHRLPWSGLWKVIFSIVLQLEETLYKRVTHPGWCGLTAAAVCCSPGGLGTRGRCRAEGPGRTGRPPDPAGTAGAWFGPGGPRSSRGTPCRRRVVRRRMPVSGGPCTDTDPSPSAARVGGSRTPQTPGGGNGCCSVIFVVVVFCFVLFFTPLWCILTCCLSAATVM